MHLMKQGAAALVLGALAMACSATVDDGGLTPGGAGGTAVGAGGTAVGTGGTGSTAPAGTGGTAAGAGGQVGSSCVAVTKGDADVAENWWAGSSDDSGTAGADNRSIAGPSILGWDKWDGPTGWANVSYALAEADGCANVAGSSFDVVATSAIAGTFRIGIVTETSVISSNHYVKTETFTAGETKTVTLSGDGAGMNSSWAPADGPFDSAAALQVVMAPLAAEGSNPTPGVASPTGPGGLAAYDFGITSITIK